MVQDKLREIVTPTLQTSPENHNEILNAIKCVENEIDIPHRDDKTNMYLNLLSKEESDILMYRMHSVLDNRNKKRKNSFNNNGNMENEKSKLNYGNTKDTTNENNIDKTKNKLDIDALNSNCENDLNYNNNNMNESINDIKLESIRAISWKLCEKCNFAILLTDLASITNLHIFNEKVNH